MNYTKRITALILALFSLLGLTACGQDPSANTESGSAEGQKWVSAGRYEGAFSDQGYYYERNHILCYLDIATGNTTALCTKAGCLHDQEPSNRLREHCDAYLSGNNFKFGGLCFWNGSMYYINFEKNGLNLFRSDVTWTEHVELGSLGTQYIENKQSITATNYALTEDYWYYSAEVKGSVWDEDALQWTDKLVLSYISRIDLRTGKEEIVVEEQGNMLELFAAQNDTVLFSTQKMPDTKIGDPASLEQLAKFPILLKRWDGETRQITTLFEKYSSECSKINGFYGGKIYYTVPDSTTQSNQHTFDISTGQDKLFLEQKGVLLWPGGYGRLVNLKPNEGKYLLDLRSGKKLPIDIEGTPGFECYAEHGCILRCPVTSADGEATEFRLCYVPYTALSDGLQEADLMQIYTW